MRSITFARTPILPFLIGIPISFSTSAGVQGDFKSGGSGGGAMDIEYVNNYPYSRCSQENIPSEDCKEFGYVFGEEPITFKQFIDLVMNTSAEQYRADMVSDNYNVPDNFHWLLPTEENLRYAKSQGILQGDNLYPVFVDDGNKDEYLAEREIQLVHLPGANLPDTINDETEVVGLLAAYALDSDGNILPGTPGEPGSPGKIDPDKGEIVILDPHEPPPPPPPPPSVLDTIESIYFSTQYKTDHGMDGQLRKGGIEFKQQEDNDRYSVTNILWQLRHDQTLKTWVTSEHQEFSRTTPVAKPCISGIHIREKGGADHYFEPKTSFCHNRIGGKGNPPSVFKLPSSGLKKVNSKPQAVSPDIKPNVSMVKAGMKREGYYTLDLTESQYIALGQPRTVTFKWKYGEFGELQSNITSVNFDSGQAYARFRYITGKKSQESKAFCLDWTELQGDLYVDTYVIRNGNSLCDGSSNGSATSGTLYFYSHESAE